MAAAGRARCALSAKPLGAEGDLARCNHETEHSRMSPLADSTVGQRLADLGQIIPPRARQMPEALGTLQKAEIEKRRPIIKAANIMCR
jgi:hypothetical protein